MLTHAEHAAAVPLAADSEVSPVRHPDLWFSDGSVVLQADNTLFSVHKSQLSRHSTIFKDMFALAGPDDPDPSSKVQACPTIRLYDTPEDVARLLVALYDGP
jgi:hypothetical protein